MVKNLLEMNCKNQNNKNSEWKKYLKENEKSYMLNEKVMIIHLIVGLIKKTLYENNSILSWTIQNF